MPKHAASAAARLGSDTGMMHAIGEDLHHCTIRHHDARGGMISARHEECPGMAGADIRDCFSSRSCTVRGCGRAFVIFTVAGFIYATTVRFRPRLPRTDALQTRRGQHGVPVNASPPGRSRNATRNTWAAPVADHCASSYATCKAVPHARDATASFSRAGEPGRGAHHEHGGQHVLPDGQVVALAVGLHIVQRHLHHGGTQLRGLRYRHTCTSLRHPAQRGTGASVGTQRATSLLALCIAEKATRSWPRPRRY